MTSILCDASPLIFLAKLDRLDLIPRVLDGDVFILRCVVDEVLSESAGPVETARLKAFFDHCEVIAFDECQFPSASLSRCDCATLNWAINNRVDWLVADDRLLRRIAHAEGLSVVGFLGILVEAAKMGLATAAEAKTAIDQSVSQHGCRISIALYRRIMAELEGI
jgi:predicted nucleic acid-binding protein